MKKVIKYLKNPKLIIIYLMNKNFFFFLSDKLFLKWKFKILMGYKLDLNNPQTFNEKLQWLKLYDRKPTYTKMVAMAKRISKGTIESRIDFYDINGKIYFGEITFFDSAGFGKFEPNEWDKKIGDMLKLPMKEEK